MKSEIKEANMEGLLNSYIERKEAEDENNKLQMKIMHVNKFNSEYHTETDLMMSIITKACEVIQDNYLLLRSLKELDNETLGNFQKLVKMLQGQRSVKFAEDDITMTNNQENYDLSFQPLDFVNDVMLLKSPVSVTKKRINGNDADDNQAKKSKNDFNFARPKAMKSISFDTQPQTSHGMNATFNLEVPPQKDIFTERTNKTSTAPSTSSVVSKGKN